jgi:porphobilinogen synthase
MSFPQTRLRRLRENAVLRESLQEVRLHPSDFIQPYFVVDGEEVKKAIKLMPGIYQYSIDQLLKELESAVKVGINKILLFGVLEADQKDDKASEAYNRRGVVQEAVKAIKEKFPELYVITDVCLCEYTDHGHCGILEDGKVLNDETLDLLAKTAVSHAEAGADMVAPSGMMDGRVKAIREALDEAHFTSVPIMSYAVKYASGFYGPFRQAAGTEDFKGDRKTYQMDFARNTAEAVREANIDVNEGADLIMVKPAGTYLDIIRELKNNIQIPIVAYQVSGEYAMLKHAAQAGAFDFEEAMLESLISFKRAGCRAIITYAAIEMAKKLSD